MKNSKHRFDRRTFLKACGLGAGAFFLPSLARGDSNALQPPRRIIFMMSELGWNPFEFRMKPPGAPDEVLLRSAYHQIPCQMHSTQSLAQQGWLCLAYHECLHTAYRQS